MDKLFGDLKNFFDSKKCTIDNFVFRLHYRFTLVTLVAFSITVTGRQYLGDPIDCISKDDIPNELLDTFCWIHATFSVDHAWHKTVGKEVVYPGVDKHLPGEHRVYHAYYQWVCFVLFLQALLFYVPRYVWKNTEAHKIQHLVMKFGSPVVVANENKDEELIVDYLEENLIKHNHRFYGYVYILTEIMNFVNVVGQMYLMDTFLGGEFLKYGTKVISFTEWDWTVRYDPMIRVFPRMTKCTFYRYGSSGDVQKHDAMCLIPINIMNEKIYVFLWFWYVTLSLLTALALAYRVLIYFLKPVRYYVLHSRCLTVKSNDLWKVIEVADCHDWLVISLMCKNMSQSNFRPIIRDLAKRLRIRFPDKKKEKDASEETDEGKGRIDTPKPYSKEEEAKETSVSLLKEQFDEPDLRDEKRD